ncbi:MAG TPA: hypothetical protein VNO79_08780 [Actinomycetota bacterium]|nr:hypothetical protein [Actinomycetota bacterium]
MAGTSQDLKITYVGDATSVTKTLAKLEGAHRSFGSRLASIGKAVGKAALVGATAGAVALAGVGKAAISAAQEAERVGAQTEAVLRSTKGAANVTAAEIGALAARIRDYSGISDEAVQAGENMLLTFTNIRNRVGEGNDIFNQATEILADMSVALGTDMSKQAVQLGKALNDPVRGVTALTRVGVTFTEQQRKQIEAMVEAGRVADAQKLILAELAKEFGGSARALGETTTGQFNILREKVGDALEQVGGRLLEVGQKVIPALTKTLTGLVETVGPVLGDFFAGFAKTLTTLLPVVAPVLAELGAAIGRVLAALGPALGQVMGALAPVLGDLASGFADILVALVPLLPPLAQLITTIAPLVPLIARIVVGLVKLLVPAFVKVIGAVTKVVAVVVGWATNWQRTWASVKAVALGVWGALTQAVRAPARAIVGAFEWVSSRLRQIWEGIKGFAGRIWDGIVGVIKGAINIFIGLVNSVIRGINDLLEVDIRLPGPIPDIHFDAPDIPEIPTLARGGLLRSGGLAVVGERGPELLQLPRGARVLPLEGPRRPILLRARIDVHIDRARIRRAEELEVQVAGW